MSTDTPILYWAQPESPLNHEIMKAKQHSAEMVPNGLWNEHYIRNDSRVIANLTYFYGTLNNFFLDFLCGFSALHK